MAGKKTKPIEEAWKKHLKANARKKKQNSLSSVAEEDYKKNFKDGINAQEGLSSREKKKLIKNLEL